MAHILFRKNGVRREVKVGYSWTTLFFGPFPFAFRGQWGWALFAAILCFLTYGLGGIVLGFYANRITGRHLFETGWQVLNPSQVPQHWNVDYDDEHTTA